MPSETHQSQHPEQPSEAYRLFFSISYYEAVIERAVGTLLQHGRQHVGLAPLARDEVLTKDRVDSEFETAERFVAPRLTRTGIGFIRMVLSDDEWSVIADSEQRPYREHAPLDKTAYDRHKASANAQVRVTSSSAPSAARTASGAKSGSITRG